MKRLARRAALAAIGVGVGLTASITTAAPASATPPGITPLPGGVIRIDVPAGEWWECSGDALQPPFAEVVPGYLQFKLGPGPMYLRYPPNTDVWVYCSGTGLPFADYGPIVKTLP